MCGLQTQTSRLIPFHFHLSCLVFLVSLPSSELPQHQSGRSGQTFPFHLSSPTTTLSRKSRSAGHHWQRGGDGHRKQVKRPLQFLTFHNGFRGQEPCFPFARRSVPSAQPSSQLVAIRREQRREVSTGSSPVFNDHLLNPSGHSPDRRFLPGRSTRISRSTPPRYGDLDFAFM